MSSCLKPHGKEAWDKWTGGRGGGERKRWNKMEGGKKNGYNIVIVDKKVGTTL